MTPRACLEKPRESMHLGCTPSEQAGGLANRMQFDNGVPGLLAAEPCSALVVICNPGFGRNECLHAVVLSYSAADTVVHLLLARQWRPSGLAGGCARFRDRCAISSLLCHSAVVPQVTNPHILGTATGPDAASAGPSRTGKPCSLASETAREFRPTSLLAGTDVAVCHESEAQALQSMQPLFDLLSGRALTSSSQSSHRYCVVSNLVLASGIHIRDPLAQQM